MGSIGPGTTIYFIPRTVLVFVWLVYGGRLQYLLSKPLEEVQIGMTNDSSFLTNASFRSEAKKKWGKNRKLFPHKTKKPATVITRLRVLAIIDLKIVQ
jgi:hypothetical protein